jgi:dolichyl-phosphate beta-glucosyltransferase
MMRILVVVRWLVIADVRDTQCGIKLLSRSFADLVLACSTVDRFAFDIELFVIALENKMSIQDFPVVLNHRKESSVRIITDTILMLIDIVKIRLKIWQGVYVRH